MNLKLPQGLSFQRPDHRAEFDRVRGELKAGLPALPFDSAVQALSDLGKALDGAVARLKRDLLGSVLCWNEDNHALTGWIHQQHRRLADSAQRLVDDSAPAAPAVKLAAFLLHHESEALKWIAGRERPPFASLHAMMARAYDGGIARHPFTQVIDGRAHESTLESMYARVLLLDRLGTGVLTRQQVEVLDAWLREWSAQLGFAQSAPDGAALYVDMDGSGGLRAEGAPAQSRLLWIALAPLEARRLAVARELQRGRIVPAFGCAAEFRIEEHVAVLRHLRKALVAPLDAGGRREARELAARRRVEAWVGIDEILARGEGARGVETGRWRTLSMGGEAAVAAAADPQRRYLWLVDTSAGGCGFEAMEQDAAGLDIGALVGWRSGGAIALGRVIRRLPGQNPGQVFLGVRLLTECGVSYPLKRMDVVDASETVDYLFVPGDDATGRRDAFLMPEKHYSQERAYLAAVDDERFTVRFNRVRERGSGWILAGFEIVPPRPVAPAVSPLEDANPLELPRFELLPQEENDDPWSKEVPMRLLD